MDTSKRRVTRLPLPYRTTTRPETEIAYPESDGEPIAETDVHRDLDTLCQHAICAGLVTAALCESDPIAQESQLHALGEMHDWDATRPELLANLVSLDRKRLDQQRPSTSTISSAIHTTELPDLAPLVLGLR